MLLRRLTKNLKEQNWTAIAIEFVLLVAGVFLGMQVQDWNSERQDRARAAELSERLRSDLIYERWTFQFSIHYYDEVFINAGRAVDALSGDAPMSDEQFLISAFRASQLICFPRQRATYDELVATGTIGLLADPQLHAMAVGVFNETLLDISQHQTLASDYHRLFRRATPALIQQALQQLCGDRLPVAGDFQAMVGALDYPCQIALSEATISAAAAALINDPALLPALQERLADLDAVRINLSDALPLYWPAEASTEAVT